MQSDYHIEDLVFQTGDFVLYRALNKEGIPLAITRIKFPFEILNNLEEGRFEEAFAGLKSLQHPCLRPVVDGGQDPVDKYPWVATQLFEGVALSSRINEAPLTEDEVLRIQSHGEALIEALGERAGAISFMPHEIVITRSQEGPLIDTFAIDYFAWFRDWSMGLEPGGNRDSHRQLQMLIESLWPSQSPANATIPPDTTGPELAAPNASASPGALVVPSAPVTAGPPAPSMPISLPSSASGGGLKVILIIVLLVGLIGGGLWWVGKRPSQADPQVVSSPESPKEKKKERKDTEPPKIVAEAPDKTPPKLVSDSTPPPTPPPTPPRPRSMEPRRPSVGAILEAVANNPASLKKLTGQWVYLKSEVASMDGGTTIHLKDSALKATLKRGSVTLDAGTKVRLVGILKSPTLLEVPDNTDVEVREEIKTLPPKSVYGAEDEQLLRTMAGQKVTVSAKVLGYKKSNSGKTSYLVLNDTKPEFAFSIVTSFAESGELGQEYLESLVGKTVKVTGSLKLDDIGQRLNIYFKYKSHLDVSGE